MRNELRWVDISSLVHCRQSVSLVPVKPRYSAIFSSRSVTVDASSHKTIATLNAQNGSTIWHLHTDRMNIFVASFVPDQDNDTVSDVLASLSSLETEGTGDGHLILFSGKTGRELRQFKTPGDAKTFYMPQILTQNSTNSFVIFGTGSPSSGGNLSVNSVDGIISGELTKESKTIYEDKFKGMMTQSVLVDITGDSIPDIVTAMFNSSLVAIDGRTFTQIWNYTIPGPPSETNISPTPAFFNYDNITDFLIVYRKYDEIFNNNYTESFIIDGKTGKSIYSPITGSVPTQMSGLVLSFESHGYDMYLFWTEECGNTDILKKVDVMRSSSDGYDDCRNHFNTTRILKLNALNQFHQPPGFVIYNSAEREQVEFSRIKSATQQLKEYYRAHPKINIQVPGQSEVDEIYNVDPSPPKIRKYGLSSFRHKDHNAGLIKSYMNAPDNENNNAEDQIPQITDTDYDWEQNQQPPMLSDIKKIKPNFDDYQIDDYNQKHLLMNEDSDISSRDPRSKDHKTKNHTSGNISKTKKKDLLGEKNGLYDYRNVRLSRNRLLHDVDYVPTEILKDTFVKNEERRLRKSKFQQRDVNTHTDKIKEKKEIQRIIDEELKEAKKSSTTLWDLESEKEMKDWVDGTYRGKRNINYSFISTAKITSVGAVVDSFNVTNGTNSIDLVFIKYWIPTSIGQQEMLKQDIQECIEDKTKGGSEDEAIHKYQKTTDAEQRALFEKECVEEQESLKIAFDYFQQLYQLQLGQMTVYRLRVECKCVNKEKNERCVNILPKDKQYWPNYLGRVGDGVFPVRG